MHAATKRHRISHRHHRRALTAGLAAALALALAGCASNTTTQSAGTAQIVTGEQVLTTCFENYFYNGVLPEAAAKANCTKCIVDNLRNLGIQRSAGETEADLLTGVRLSSSVIHSLQNACTEPDASSQ